MFITRAIFDIGGEYMLFGVILKSNTGIYRLVLIRYNEKRMRYEQAFIYGNSKKIIQAIYKCKPILINATIQSGDKIYFRKYKNLMSQIESIAKIVRRVFEDRIGTGTDLCGYCIMASELLLGIYVSLGYMGRTVEGWCEFDDEYYGSDRPYDEHTWLELFVNNKKLYIDITADQFNPGMYKENEYPAITINMGLPHGMSYSEPVMWE